MALKTKKPQNKKNTIFNCGSSYHETNFKLDKLFLKNSMRKMQMLQNRDLGYLRVNVN